MCRFLFKSLQFTDGPVEIAGGLLGGQANTLRVVGGEFGEGMFLGHDGGDLAGVGEAVLGDDGMALADGSGRRVLPVGQAHMGLCRVGAGAHDLGGRMTVSGRMHLVLDGLKETLGHLGPGIVVDAGGVNVCDLLVEEPFGQTNVANACEQFVEVFVAEGSPRLNTFVVESEAFDEEFGKPWGGPLSKGRAARRPNLVADGENGFQVVVIYRTRYAAGAFDLNY